MTSMYHWYWYVSKVIVISYIMKKAGIYSRLYTALFNSYDLSQLLSFSKDGIKVPDSCESRVN